MIKGDKVKVKTGEYMGYTKGSVYNLPREIGIIVGGSAAEGYIEINYGEFTSPPVNPVLFDIVDDEIGRLRIENDRLRTMLFSYADATEISGVSWNGFYLIGNKASIKEFKRLQNDALQIEVFRKAFDEGIAAAKVKNERLRHKLNIIRKALKGEDDEG